MAAFTSRAIVAMSAAPSGTMTRSIDDSVPCSSAMSAAAEAHESKTVTTAWDNARHFILGPHAGLSQAVVSKTVTTARASNAEQRAP